ncbi:apolipoprotein L3 [Oryzias melastigma]|uniref:apolipoprotein L3 n=1 Tax=Oryzias melastigma TaxID=30732 RepID=UPI000CF8333B|nr:apolipoprotein L3 [Oryzias melastigma]
MHQTKATPPVPLPRKHLTSKATSLDEEQLRSNRSPEAPAETSPCPTKPPPVLPKTKIIRQKSEMIQTFPLYEEMQPPTYEEVLKDMDKHFYKNGHGAPPALPIKTPKSKPDIQTVATIDQPLSSMNMSWKDCYNDLKDKGASEKRIIETLAEYLYEEVQKYNSLMTEDGKSLREAIDDLRSIAANLNKVSKGTKIAGITGGATTALGGVAAAAGVILSPFTMGSSLALTAIGVGVATAGGVTGASAAITNKANFSSDKKKIQQTLQDFEDHHEKIRSCLEFIIEGIDQLKLHGVSTLSQTKTRSEKATKMLKMVTGDMSAMAGGKCTKVSGTIQGFALGMDLYFTKGKDGQKLKKDLKSKFAKNIEKLAEDLEEGFKELSDIFVLFGKHY